MPRGRPRKVAEELLAQEVRLAPSDGQPIQFDDEELKRMCPRFAAFEEGGAETGPKLHYHCMFETAYTENIVKQVLNRLVKADMAQNDTKGNAVLGGYKRQHEGSLGYNAKCGKCVFRHGYDNLWLEECFTRNAAYWRQKEATKKAKQRAAKAFTDEIHDMLTEETPTGVHWSTRQAVEKVLDYYARRRVQFPPKSTMERIIHRYLWSTNRDSDVVDAYMKNLPGQ